jgi:hypothetical protein
MDFKDFFPFERNAPGFPLKLKLLDYNHGCPLVVFIGDYLPTQTKGKVFPPTDD